MPTTLRYPTPPLYPTPRTPSSLTWVLQIRLAFGHHKNVGSASLTQSYLTTASLAAGGYDCLRQWESFSIETHPLCWIEGLMPISQTPRTPSSQMLAGNLCLPPSLTMMNFSKVRSYKPEAVDIRVVYIKSHKQIEEVKTPHICLQPPTHMNQSQIQVYKHNLQNNHHHYFVSKIYLSEALYIVKFVLVSTCIFRCSGFFRARPSALGQ